MIIRSILGPFQGISGAMEVPPPFSPSRSPPNPSPALSVGRSTLCTSVISLAAPRAVASLPAALCAVRLGGSVVRAAAVKVTLTGTAAAGDCGGTGRALEGYWEHWEGLLGLTGSAGGDSRDLTGNTGEGIGALLRALGRAPGDLLGALGLTGSTGKDLRALLGALGWLLVPYWEGWALLVALGRVLGPYWEHWEWY